MTDVDLLRRAAADMHESGDSFLMAVSDWLDFVAVHPEGTQRVTMQQAIAVAHSYLG